MPRVLRIASKVLVVAVLALAAQFLIRFSTDLISDMPPEDAGRVQIALMVFALALYALLIAIPFVPGIEIALALLILRGPSIAPEIFLATLLGLSLAFMIGRVVPEPSLARALGDLRLRRAAAFVDKMAALPASEKHAAFGAIVPRALQPALGPMRYLGLALVINLPGNAIVGGGGGILMAAGLSRLFHPWLTVLTVALAIAPFPLSIWWFGMWFQ